MEEANADNCIICKICGETTINRIRCQNCKAKLDLRINPNNLFNQKINPRYDNIITINLKEKLRIERERERERKAREREIKEREEKERREKEKFEIEQKKILKEVKDKYDKIKNDLPVPFSIDKNQIDKLIHSNNEKCSICLQEFIVENEVLYLPCSHLFHSICILRWLLKNNKCPICQIDYRKIDDDEEKQEEEEENINNDMNMNINNNNFILNNNIYL